MAVNGHSKQYDRTAACVGKALPARQAVVLCSVLQPVLCQLTELWHNTLLLSCGTTLVVVVVLCWVLCQLATLLRVHAQAAAGPHLGLEER